MYGTRPVERPMWSAQALRSLGRKERRRVRAITALTPEQVAAAYGTTRP
jgi:hypothetical protein